MTEQLLTAEKVAELTGLSRRSVYRAVDTGELDAYRLRGRVRIPEAALQRWLDAHRIAPRRREPPAGDLHASAAGPSELRKILLSETSTNQLERGPHEHREGLTQGT